MLLAATSPRTTAPAIPANEPAIVAGMRADSMLGQVTRLGGPRPAGSADAKRAAELIRDTAIANGWDARIEHVDGDLDLWNVVAERAGTAPDGERKLVLAGAHLDTVPGAWGANDDASGTAALLEATKVFAANPTRHDLRFIWFDGEELGLLGSRAYVQRHGEELRRASAMVAAEMLGSPRGTPHVVVTNREMANATKPAIEAAERNGIRTDVVVDPMAGSDHMPFAKLGIPSMVVATALPRTIHHDDPNYHSGRDTPDKLNSAVYETAGDLFALAVNAYANT